MSNEPINPNEGATPDPRVETQRHRSESEAAVLTYGDDTLPIDSDHKGLVSSDDDTTRPVPSLQNEEEADNPTGDDHFFKVAPTSTSAASATQQIDEDFEEEED